MSKSYLLFLVFLIITCSLSEFIKLNDVYFNTNYIKSFKLDEEIKYKYEYIEKDYLFGYLKNNVSVKTDQIKEKCYVVEFVNTKSCCNDFNENGNVIHYFNDRLIKNL